MEAGKLCWMRARMNRPKRATAASCPGREIDRPSNRPLAFACGPTSLALGILGVIFLMNAESVDQAKAILDSLPLVSAGFLKFEYVPVGPLAPLGLLLQGK